MTSDESSRESRSVSAEPQSSGGAPRITRASAVWVAVAGALLLLILLIVFILQNPTKVDVQFLGAQGTLSLGMALLIAAVAGGVLVAIAGIARVTQLRLNARRIRRSTGA
jgi:uncharacterized integral membrane protein